MDFHALRWRLLLAGGAFGSVLGTSRVVGQNDITVCALGHSSESGAAAVAEDPPRHPAIPRTIDRESGDWTGIGPEGIEVLRIAVGRADEPSAGSPAVLFVTTRNSGVLRSADGGETWSEASGGLPHERLSSLALHQEPIASGGAETTLQTTLYAGSRSAGIFRSTDQGSSWTPINKGLASLEVHDLSLDAAGRIYAATGGGLFQSADRGDTWTGPTHEPAWTLAIDPTSPRTLYAGGELTIFRSEDGGVSRSDDQGATWHDASGGLPPGTVNDLVLDPASPSIVYAATRDGVYLDDVHRQ